MVAAVYFFYRPMFSEKTNVLEDMNTGLILFGIVLALDAFKDYRKLTWLDKKVYHKPRVAKYYFIFFTLLLFGMIITGINSYFSTEDHALKELSTGFIVLGIGAFGILKAGIEATKRFMELGEQS